jgi:hypothetical protein
MKRLPWEDAIKYYRYPSTCVESYTEGFRSGWIDSYLGLDSRIAKTSSWGNYASGYVDGKNAYRYYNPVIQEGEVTCLENILSIG